MEAQAGNVEDNFDLSVARSVRLAEEANKYRCSCEVTTITSLHRKTAPLCDLWECEPWINGECEWSPEHDKILWYYAEANGKWLTDFDQIWIDDSEAEDLWDDGEELECTCTPPKRLCCVACGVEREKDTDPWGPMQWADYGYGGWTNWTPCRHAMAQIQYPDGTKIYASSHHSTRAKDELQPTLGFYLDDIWRPDCLAIMVPWTDHGLPRIKYETVAQTIVNTFEKAKSGEIVEVGCIGGHGRTGTVLACFAILAGVKAKNAVSWVQKNYCKNAIESDLQEWFPLWFDAWHKGKKPPAKPVVKTWTKSTTTQSPGATQKTVGTSSVIHTESGPIVVPGTSTTAEQERWKSLKVGTCVECKRDLTLDTSKPDVRRWRCIEKDCRIGKVNIAKEAELAEDKDVHHLAQKYLNDGNFLFAAIMQAMFSKPYEYEPWPGSINMVNVAKEAERPLTWNEIVLRARKRGVPDYESRLEEVVSE